MKTLAHRVLDPEDLGYAVSREIRDEARRELGIPPCESSGRSAHPQADLFTAAAHDVLAERQRQISAEGWTPQHDDEHCNDDIAAAACFYAMPPGARAWDASSTGYGATLGEAIQPSDWNLKPGDRRRELVKAGALILAEIERLDRAAAGKQ